MFAICTVLIAFLAATFIAAALFGAIHPRKTAAGQLRIAAANIAAAYNLVLAQARLIEFMPAS